MRFFETKKSREKRVNIQKECIEMFLNVSPAKAWIYAKKRGLPYRFIQSMQQLVGVKYEMMNIKGMSFEEYEVYAREVLNKQL